ncbi:hypothetical protein OM416_19830 [Paenibacillus sp. LS1]|uniref:hypothetical protein n=1 Tax=Paenibacillus sp. LS1 TaxID=2992120 RepID=UPI00222E80AD|nr:hypothetical protein [Paenibacillus sp. LS1]MCW3793846.1 hypothetical protein [Paenibacillus sp. LS1]
MSRIRMMFTNSFENETYRCRECDKDLEDTEVTDRWTCVHCEQRVIIDAPILDQEIVRKFPDEVTTQDIFLKQDHQSHLIHDIKQNKSGGYDYVLKGFGTHKQDKNKFAHILY